MRSISRFLSQNRSLLKSFKVPQGHDYFRHTSNTWVYNATEQHSVRHLEFNVAALIDEAIHAAEATSCVKFTKLGEDLANKLFEIKLDNGQELIAKLPYPVAGPSHFTTASEVATMQFVRELLELPVPRVLAWSSHAEKSAVKAEFIIMEKLEGKPLKDVWENLSDSEVFGILEEIVEIEYRLTESHFHSLGCLYYTEDIPDGVPSIPSPFYDADKEVLPLKGYCIGPSVARRFWRGRRWELNFNRGPWKSIADYNRSVIDCEIAWLKAYAKPHPRESPQFRSDRENDPESHIELLKKYALVVPSLVPIDEFNCHRLWHPDLHGSNLLVSTIDGKHRITGILDWQGACIDLLLMAGHVHDCVNPTSRYIPRPDPGAKSPLCVLPDNYDSLPKSKQLEVKKEWKATRRYQVYTSLVESQIPLLHAHRTLDTSFLGQFPWYWASCSWDHGFAFLERSLILIYYAWSRFISRNEPCPIRFSKSEIRTNKRAMALAYREAEVIESVLAEVNIHPEGWVAWYALEEAQRGMEVVRERYIRNLPESEREEARRQWPFQDGALSLTAEPCRPQV